MPETTQSSAAAFSSRSVGQTLAEYFAEAGNRSPRKVKRALLLAVGAVAAVQEADGVLTDLWPMTLFVLDGGRRIVYRKMSAEARQRPDAYRAPEYRQDPWRINQYALGVAFHHALTGFPGEDDPQIRTRLGLLVKQLERFDVALAIMTESDPADRFETPRKAVRFIAGIPVWSLWKWFAAVAFLFLVASAGGLFLFTRRNLPQDSAPPTVMTHTMPAPRPPQPVPAKTYPGMAAVSPGPVRLHDATVEVPGFQLDIREVTVADYEQFAKTQGLRSPFAGTEYVQQHPGHPVWNVSWQDASNYCKALERHLPTEMQWLRAYQSGEYIWREGTPTPAQANVEGKALKDTGVFTTDRTKTRITDLAGNLPEWTQDEYKPVPGLRIVRGGGYYLPAAMVIEQLAIAGELDPGKGYLRVGFRCAAE